MEKIYFKKGDVITTTPDMANDLMRDEPILVLKDMVGTEADDGFCNLVFGKSGGLVNFWHNPEFAVLCNEQKASHHYWVMKYLSGYLLGDVTDSELENAIGEELYQEFMMKKI